MAAAKRGPNWLNYKIRICRTNESTCRLCKKSITLGDPYRDGGYRLRAHLRCVDTVVDQLLCGHPRSALRLITYRCDQYLAGGCDQKHDHITCVVCIDIGTMKWPDDFGHEITRDYV